MIGWGYYYLVTVMDDFSRFILAWKLQTDMTAASLIDVVQDAVDVTGMTDVPVEDRTRLLSDNGPGYVSRSFREYLQLIGIRHILAAPFHPQTNGKAGAISAHLILDGDPVITVTDAAGNTGTVGCLVPPPPKWQPLPPHKWS